MATAIKFEKRESAVPLDSSALTPELKAFIDRAVVPTLVKAYLKQTVSKNVLALSPEEIDNRPRSLILPEESTK
jgi:hypothetical protein